MEYRIEVRIPSVWLTINADNPEEARKEAEEMMDGAYAEIGNDDTVFFKTDDVEIGTVEKEE